MRTRSLLLGAMALVAIGLAPRRLEAQCGYTYSLGLGGSIAGCFGGSITEIGEDALYQSGQYFWTGNFGASAGPDNAPTVAGTFMFDDSCGSGGAGVFAFCTGGFTKPVVPITSATGELVLGLRVPDPTQSTPFTWVYSGQASRNAVPPPAGYAAVLLQLTNGGIDDAGQFLFGWEDMNTGCTQRTELTNDRFREEDLNNGALLNTVLADCTALTPGGNSDSDFNDSYMRLNIQGIGTSLSTVPEPMTMSLLAIGLAGMSATSLRRRKK